MKNKKGFVMTETLVVTVFLVTIFTFIYISIIPLIGKYEDMVNRNADIDIVYKLYHIRKMVENDANESSIVSKVSKPITCSDFASNCTKLMSFLDLNSYLLIYTNSISSTITNLKNSSYVSTNFGSYSQVTINEILEYLDNHKTETGNYLILLDRANHTIAHLKYYK